MTNFITKYKKKKEYIAKLQKFLRKGFLDEGDKKELTEFRNTYFLSRKGLKPSHQKALSLLFSQIISDQRITEAEKKNLEKVCDYLELNTSDFSFNQKKFNKFYSLARIDEGLLPDIECSGIDIILKENEKIYWLCPATLVKYKKVVDRFSFAGFRSSIRICRGFSYRAGSYKVASDLKEYLVSEDTGNLWITNQRLGFRGQRKNIIVSFSKVNMFDVTEAGLIIFKDGKDTPYILALNDYDVPLSVLSLLLNKRDK